jgi:uncharacterized membrane protein
LIISSLLLLAAVLAGLLLWDSLPDPVASHWNANDQVDGYMSRFWGVFMVPLIALAMLLLFLAVPYIDPLKANIAAFRPAFNLFILFFMLFMLYVHALTLAWNLGYHGFRMSSAMLPFMGLLFIGIGWLMRSAKRNFFIGIRTPWTLSSDYVWDKTHRLGSILFMVSGLFAILAAFLGGQSAFVLMFVPLVGSSLFLVLYSYLVYRQETRS